jgi:Na+/H+-dicarboxylate symporter
MLRLTIKNEKFLTYAVILVLAIYCGLNKLPLALNFADYIARYFVTFLKWLSIPLIAFSLLSTTKNLSNSKEFIYLGGKVFKYTLLTTILSASIALGYFLLISPSNVELAQNAAEYHFMPDEKPIYGYLLFASLIAAIVVSFLAFRMQEINRLKLHIMVTISNTLLRKLINGVLFFMPLAIWSFITLFINDFENATFISIGLYLLCIVAANITQAVIVLPLLLSLKKISTKKVFKAMLPAIMVAFWTKSSSVALQVAIDCARKNLALPPKLANFSLPLCIVINMNACAAFILTTVLFVSTSHGVAYSAFDYMLWVLAATLAAIGNAGVPMGCYTLSCAILGMLGVPLYLLGIILPCYALIDMLESAINVWSDACVSALVAVETGHTID